MTSVREAIVAAVALLLQDIEDVTVYRSRVEALSRRQAPAIVVEPGRDTATASNTHKRLDWTFQLLVAVYTRGAIPDQLADPIICAIHDALMADRTLGGLCIDIVPDGVDPQLEAGDMPTLWSVCTYRVRYRTLTDDLTVSV